MLVVWLLMTVSVARMLRHSAREEMESDTRMVRRRGYSESKVTHIVIVEEHEAIHIATVAEEWGRQDIDMRRLWIQEADQERSEFQ